ncbi:hypothetical protein LZ30DRAFT_343689 [Colletotrichum cereale]|nr:hypothetical protein LZ30DRAFT_343689 [Colletotrichum cereale]
MGPYKQDEARNVALDFAQPPPTLTLSIHHRLVYETSSLYGWVFFRKHRSPAGWMVPISKVFWPLYREKPQRNGSGPNKAGKQAGYHWHHHTRTVLSQHAGGGGGWQPGVLERPPKPEASVASYHQGLLGLAAGTWGWRRSMFQAVMLSGDPSIFPTCRPGTWESLGKIHPS